MQGPWMSNSSSNGRRSSNSGRRSKKKKTTSTSSSTSRSRYLLSSFLPSFLSFPHSLNKEQTLPHNAICTQEEEQEQEQEQEHEQENAALSQCHGHGSHLNNPHASAPCSGPIKRRRGRSTELLGAALTQPQCTSFAAAAAAGSAAGGQPRQGKAYRRYRPLREISKVHIPFVPFVRMVREITHQFNPEIKRLTPTTLLAIKEAAEYHLVDLLATPQGKKILHLLSSPGSSSIIIFHLLSSPGSSSNNSISGATTSSSSESDACIHPSIHPLPLLYLLKHKPQPQPRRSNKGQEAKEGQASGRNGCSSR